MRATRGSSCRVPGSRQVFPDPSAASKRLGPPGARIPSRPRGGVRDRPGGAGGTGRRESSGRGRSRTPTRSGRRRPGAGPAAPPLRSSMQSADQRDGRSHSAAIEQADALRPRPADLQRRLPGAPGPLGGGAGPVAGDRPEPPAGSRPRRVRGRPPAPSPTRRKHTPDRSGTARAPRRQPDRTLLPLNGALPGRGHGSSASHGFRPSTTPGAIQILPGSDE